MALVGDTSNMAAPVAIDRLPTEIAVHNPQRRQQEPRVWNRYERHLSNVLQVHFQQVVIFLPRQSSHNSLGRDIRNRAERNNFLFTACHGQSIENTRVALVKRDPQRSMVLE